MSHLDCPFCEPASDRLVKTSAYSTALWDLFPVSKGHGLVIPKKHVQSLFDLTTIERGDLMDLLGELHLVVQQKYEPDGFNIGINDGKAAGQTVSHLHLHLIPRYAGDQADPRGGIRWVMPEKAKYWKDEELK